MRVLSRLAIIVQNLFVCLINEGKGLIGHQGWINPFVCTGSGGKVQAQEEVSVLNIA